MTNKSKAKGTAWETALVNYFRSKPWWRAERLTLSGKEDEGDIVVYPTDHERVVIVEAKAERQMNLSAYVLEAEREASNYAKHRDLEHVPHWIVVVKRRNKPAGQAYVVTTLDEFYRQVEGL